jgi:hypothetical protein
VTSKLPGQRRETGVDVHARTPHFSEYQFGTSEHTTTQPASTTRTHSMAMEPPARPSSALFDVFLRLRPSRSANARFLTVEDGEGNHPTHITIKPPTSDNRKRAIERFAFTRVFEEDAHQKELFNSTGVVPMIEGVLGAPGHHGRDGLLATLGVTGSGKVHDTTGMGLELSANTSTESHDPRNQVTARPCADVSRCPLPELRRTSRAVVLWRSSVLITCRCRRIRVAHVHGHRVP